jgi:hypothetical protein
VTVCSRRPRMSGPSSVADCQSGNLAIASGATACAVTPDDHWSGRPESNRRRPAWEFPYEGLTKCHFLSESITSGHTVSPGFSRFVIPSHVIWAASWAARAGHRVMPDTTAAWVRGARGEIPENGRPQRVLAGHGFASPTSYAGRWHFPWNSRFRQLRPWFSEHQAVGL